MIAQFTPDQLIECPPWPAVQQRLSEKYNIITEIDLALTVYDPWLLYHALQSAYKQSYDPKDRILIFHNDLDFYLDQKSPMGFAIINLLWCLRYLDIPTNFCLLFTNHYGIGQDIKSASKHEFGMHVFESNYNMLQANPEPSCIDINIDKIKKPFICLNGAQRSHRILLLSYLRAYNLLDQGILSWHFQRSASKQQSISKEKRVQPKDQDWNYYRNQAGLNLLTTVPTSRGRDHFDFDPCSQQIFQQNQAFFGQDFKDPSIQGSSNEHRWDLPCVQDAMLYVSVETIMEYPYPYLTEKTFRAILHKRPFVIVGPVGSLRQIKKLGFKTFDALWDEQYDSIEDPNQRIRAIIDIINHVCSLSRDQLIEMLYTAQDVIEYNFWSYKTGFAGKNLYDRLETL